ncbi:MAG: tetratricopeptide repeat protein [Gammaproteobacteria bacterium]|nr:tetratricopeptide repeat protein [Gammaproteobacteria bacterium]
MDDQAISSLWQRADQQLRYGNAAGAIETLREALSIAPHMGGLHSFLAFVLTLHKRLYAAAYEAELGLRLEPENPFCHYVQGRVCLLQNKAKLAHTYFTSALELAPEHADYLMGLSAASEQMGKMAEAQQYLQQALSISPDDPDIHERDADLKLRLGQRLAAEHAYREALRLQPNHRDALIGLGQMLLVQGDVAQARDHAIWVLQQDANHVGAIRLLAEIKMRDSIFLGCWWRFNAWLTRGSQQRVIGLLIALYLIFQVSTLALGDAGYPNASFAITLLWLAVVIYSWVGPTWFQRVLKRELATVKLKGNF